VRRMTAVLIVVVGILWPLTGVGQQSSNFTGRVVEATSKRGVPKLEVRLTPPRQTKLPIRVTSTDQDGVFLFRQLVRGRYLLDISEGLYLLHRVEVDTSQLNRIDIPLRLKR
jgi:Carboxypeptidase regulatory-like domain